MLTAAIEDYLKTIYLLQEKNQAAPVANSAIAARLGVAYPSVTAMLKRMAAGSPALIDYEPFSGARLTPEGKKVAVEVLRHHRLLETFLTQVLGYGWDEVHAEAELLEHHLSDTLEERIAGLLGHPQRDPHGEAIPDSQGNLPALDEICLSHLPIGQPARISRVAPDNLDILRHLEEQALMLDTLIEVSRVVPYQGAVFVRKQASNREEIPLARAVTDRVFVSLIHSIPEREISI